MHVYPGEDELKALANNAIGALTGELPVNTYHLPVGNRTILPRPQQLRPVVQLSLIHISTVFVRP